MSGAALALAAYSIVRPTSLAAVVALLVARRPRTLLLAYILAGFVVSVAIGVAVVLAFHKLAAHHSKSHAWVDLGIGVLALAGAVYTVIRERRHPRQADSPSKSGDGWMAKRLRDPSIAAAGIAGIATHAPGAFYLGALSAILDTKPSALNGVLQVLIYNLIWFAMPIAALVLSISDEEDARARIESVGAWARRNDRWLGPLLLAGVGVYLVAKGVSHMT